MNKSVLVIDDDLMLRDALATGLRKNGFTVIKSESAESAKMILKRTSVDAIVLDRMMEGQDGLSFLQQIRQSGNETPVIMLTALSGAENAIAGLSKGANDYMAKPFKLQELVLRLNNIIKLSNTAPTKNELPNGLLFIDNEFFINTGKNTPNKLLLLSKEEKKLLQNLTMPVGNIVAATPMVAKRLRNKINGVLSNIDIVTVRGMGYKMITTKR